jgi:hypothetical protein
MNNLAPGQAMRAESSTRDDDHLLSDEESHQPAPRSLVAKPAETTSRLGNSPSVEIQASAVRQNFDQHLADDASRLAALLLGYIGRLCALVAPCRPGALSAN